MTSNFGRQISLEEQIENLKNNLLFIVSRIQFNPNYVQLFEQLKEAVKIPWTEIAKQGIWEGIPELFSFALANGANFNVIVETAIKDDDETLLEGVMKTGICDYEDLYNKAIELHNPDMANYIKELALKNPSENMMLEEPIRKRGRQIMDYF